MERERAIFAGIRHTTSSEYSVSLAMSEYVVALVFMSIAISDIAVRIASGVLAIAVSSFAIVDTRSFPAIASSSPWTSFCIPSTNLSLITPDPAPLFMSAFISKSEDVETDLRPLKLV